MPALTEQYIEDNYAGLSTDLEVWTEQGVTSEEDLGAYLDNEFLCNIDYDGSMEEYKAEQITRNIALAVARKRRARNAYVAPTLASVWRSGA